MKMLVGVILLTLGGESAFANTAIETETAELGEQGQMAVSQSIDYERGRDGRAAETVTQFEYAITDRSEILIEPFFHVWDLPKDEPRAEGAGDLEITPSYMVVLERSWIPALVLACKVKVPTGSKNVGGTGRYDFFPYLILGQHYEGWTFNANVGLNFAQPEEGGAHERTLVWDFEMQHDLPHGWTVFAEAFSAEDAVKTVSLAVQHQLTKHLNLFIAVGYTEEHTFVFRPGFNIEF